MTPLERFLQHVHQIRSTGGGVDETSYYGALEALFNEIGNTLKPHVFCVLTLANRGEGHADAGFYTEEQREKKKGHEPRQGQKPSRGAIEVKPPKPDVAEIAKSKQVQRYLNSYRQVLVTNLREFVLLAYDLDGHATQLEHYTLAQTEREFWDAASHPRRTAELHNTRFVEFLKRVMLHQATIAAPEDLAFFLASYARDALARIEVATELDTLAGVRSALEEALGLKFEGPKGEHFFRSSLIQTLFYGVFSAWVLWARQRPHTSRDRFRWSETARLLRVPVIRKLFHEVAEPGQLRQLKLEEVLDWAAERLNRVDRAEFFRLFQETQAVQYFYEPFLEAFDPELRKQLGVWYTPHEVVEYMVARVDTVLREELGVADGLADKNVYVLDPCCGTGSYLVTVLERIHQTLKARGEDALIAADLKEAAQNRVFGFEILPAPFVVSHLQLGLLLQRLGAPLADERVGVYLTNALTGWEPPKGPKQHLIFPELEEERDAAEKVKRDTPILVILGNPPYNGFAGVALEEERELTNAYRTTKRAPAPQGQGLNDLYVRFYRMAERRIVEKTGKGVVSYISNYSWLDGLSFTGMRERYLEAFDRIWIDNLHGDRIISEYAPDGRTSETVFAIRGKSVGIKVGTAISLLVRKKSGDHPSTAEVSYRDLDQARADERRQVLLQSLHSRSLRDLFSGLSPQLELGLPFKLRRVARDYLTWPRLPELFAVSFPGVKTSRDDFVVDIDRARLVERVEKYFDPAVSDEEMATICPSVLKTTKRFDAKRARYYLQKRGVRTDNVVRYSYRPFDLQWAYWEPETKLLDEKREELFSILRGQDEFLTSRQKGERHREGTPFYTTRFLPDWHLTRPGSMCFPSHASANLSQSQQEFHGTSATERSSANLTEHASNYLGSISLTGLEANTSLRMPILATGYSPTYLSENADTIRQDWPRIPLPNSKKLLEASAELGRQIAALLDTETTVPTVTTGEIRPELRDLGRPSKAGGGQLKGGEDFAITAGWGHAGEGGITMPGKGKLVERDYSPAERKAIETGAKALGLSSKEAFTQLGERTCDVYLNDVAYWANVPEKVWDYTIGGYQVIKKWLSYREEKLLGRPLTKDEVRYVQEMVRRIAATLLLQPALDANYRAVKENTYPWPTGS